MYSIGSNCIYNVYRSIPEHLKEQTMKRITELLQGIKHSDPLKESNEAKLLCSNAYYKYREKCKTWKLKQVKSY